MSATAATVKAATNRWRRIGRASPVIAGADEVDVEVVDSASSANATSLALWNRSSACFSRQWCTMRTSPGGAAAAGGETNSDGSSRRIAVIVSAAVPAWKARRPDTISYSTQPNEKMSER